MDFDFTEEQRLLQDSVDRLLADHYTFDKRKGYLAEPAGWSRALWAQYAELGLLGMPFAEAHGGFGRPPKPLSEEAEALFGLVKQAGEDLGQEIGWQPSGGVCDGNNIAACGVPVGDTMGVRGGEINSMEEFLIIESLPERAALSALTILRLAAGAA